MNKKKIVKINESRLKKIIAEATKRVLREGTSDNLSIEKWDYLREVLGEGEMLDCIFQWSSSNQIEQWLEWFEEEGYLDSSQFDDDNDNNDDNDDEW